MIKEIDSTITVDHGGTAEKPKLFIIIIPPFILLFLFLEAPCIQGISVGTSGKIVLGTC